MTPSTFGCVCATESHWRCGVHGKITPEKRAAARYGREVGDDRRADQERLAETVFVCCGEPRELGHHPQCANWTEPVEVHPDQETLV